MRNVLTLYTSSAVLFLLTDTVTDVLSGRFILISTWTLGGSGLDYKKQTKISKDKREREIQ